MKLVLSDGERELDLFSDSNVYVASEGLNVPLPDLEGTFAESAGSEGRSRVRSRALNGEGSFIVFIKASTESDFWDACDDFMELVQVAHREKGTLEYQPVRADHSVIWDLEVIRVTGLPQRGVWHGQLVTECEVTFETKPYGRLVPGEFVIHAIGDVHFSDFNSRVANVTSDRDAMECDVRVQLGDLTDDGQTSQDTDALAWLAAAEVDYVVPGNHDLSDYAGGTYNTRTPAQFASTYSAYMDGENFTVDAGRFRLVFLGDVLDGALRTVPDDSIDWLDATLGATDRPCLIFCHYPLPHTCGESPTEPQFRTDLNWSSTIAWPEDRLRAVLRAHTNAKAWISGHTHTAVDAENVLSVLPLGDFDGAWLARHTSNLLALTGTVFTEADTRAEANMLTTNQAGFESGTTGWTASVSGSTTLDDFSRQSTWAEEGTYSGYFKATSAGTNQAANITSSGMAVTVGQKYSAVARINVVQQSSTQKQRLLIVWYDGSSAFLSAAVGAVAPGLGEQTLRVTGTAPASAATCRLIVGNSTYASGGIGSGHVSEFYVDYLHLAHMTGTPSSDTTLTDFDGYISGWGTVVSGSTTLNSFDLSTTWKNSKDYSMYFKATSAGSSQSAYAQLSNRVACVPGDTVAASAWVNVVQAGVMGCRLFWVFYDPAGNFMASYANSSPAVAGDIKELTAWVRIPPGCESFRLLLGNSTLGNCHLSNGEVSEFYFDDVRAGVVDRVDGLFTETDIRAAANLLTTNQAGFESGLTGWQDTVSSSVTVDNWEQSSTWAAAGTYSARFKATSAGARRAAYVETIPGIAVSAGDRIAGVCRMNLVTSPAIEPAIYLRWVTADGDFISITRGEVAEASGVQTLRVSGVAPEGAERVALYVGNSAERGLENGEVTEFYVDSCALASMEFRAPETTVVPPGRSIVCLSVSAPSFTGTSIDSSDVIAAPFIVISGDTFEARFRDHKNGVWLETFSVPFADQVGLEGPVDWFEVNNVLGQVEAFGDLSITDSTGVDRHFVEVGVQDRFDPADPEPVLLEADDLTPLAGSLNTRSGSWSDSTVRSAATSVTAVVCSTGSLPHHGLWKVWARVYGSADCLVRLSWRIGEGAWTRERWVSVQGERWMDRDLAVVNIGRLESNHSWEARIEVMAESGTGTVDVDTVSFVPADRYFVGRGQTSLDMETSQLVAMDDFSGSSVAALDGQTPLVVPSGTWDRSGDTDDWQVVTGNWATRTAVSDGPDWDDGCFARMGSGSLAEINMTVNYDQIGVGFTGMFLRHVDDSNFVFAGSFWNYPVPAGYGIRVIKVIGGTAVYSWGGWVRTEATSRSHTVSITEDGELFAYDGNNLVISLSADDDLSTGGTLASGGYGLYHRCLSSTIPFGGVPLVRDVAVSSTPRVVNPAIATDRKLTLTHEAALTETDRYTAPTPIREGDYLKLLPATRNLNRSRIVVRARRSDPTVRDDTGLDDTVTARLTTTARVTL